MIELARVVPHGNEIVVVVFWCNYLRPVVKLSGFVFGSSGESVPGRLDSGQDSGIARCIESFETVVHRHAF